MPEDMMRFAPAPLNRRTVLPLLLVGLLAVSACVRLVSDYDEQMDKGATDLNKKIVLVVLDNIAATPPDGIDRSYKASIKRYADVRADVRSLLVRAASQGGSN